MIFFFFKEKKIDNKKVKYSQKQPSTQFADVCEDVGSLVAKLLPLSSEFPVRFPRDFQLGCHVIGRHRPAQESLISRLRTAGRGESSAGSATWRVAAAVWGGLSHYSKTEMKTKPRRKK
jgi:hypothetical protein